MGIINQVQINARISVEREKEREREREREGGPLEGKPRSNFNAGDES